MDDVFIVQRELEVLRKEVVTLRKKVSLLEKRLAKKRDVSPEGLPTIFREENYEGKLVFAGTFRSFSHALIRTQLLLDLNLSPDVLLLHSGMFAVALKSKDVRSAVSLCSFLEDRGIKCFVGKRNRYALQVFPVGKLFSKAEELLKEKNSVKIDGLKFVKTSSSSAKAYLCKKVKDGYIALIIGGIL